MICDLVTDIFAIASISLFIGIAFCIAVYMIIDMIKGLRMPHDDY
jgi:hypothetical protein